MNTLSSQGVPSYNPHEIRLFRLLGTNGDALGTHPVPAYNPSGSRRKSITGDKKEGAHPGALFSWGEVPLSPVIKKEFFFFIYNTYSWGQRCPQLVPRVPSNRSPP